MNDSTDPGPAPKAPPSPAQTLKDLAGALETKVNVPSWDRIREILASFKASGLDRPTQEMIIEAREDAKQDRAPDPLALRMIAKALSSAGAKPKKAKPAPAVVDPQPSARANPAEAAPIKAAPGLKDWNPSDMTDVDRMEPTADFAKAVLDHFPKPVRQDLDVGIAELGKAIDARRLAELDADLDQLRGQADRAVAALTDREREVLADRFGPPKRNGNGGAPPIAQFDVLKGVNYIDGLDVSAYETDQEIPAAVRTDAEWIAHAADVIEHLDMPMHAELCGELYALAQKLEEQPIQNLSAAPLLDRVEAEIERRIEKAIVSKADLPVWLLSWARDERSRADFQGARDRFHGVDTSGTVERKKD